jgi:hypothetical protein
MQPELLGYPTNALLEVVAMSIFVNTFIATENSAVKAP